MRIVSVESTDLFVGTAQRPLQVVRVTLVNDEPGTASARLGVQGAGVRDPGPFGVNDLNAGEQKAFEVPVEIAAPYQPGSTRQVTVTLEGEAGRVQAETDITVAEPGWTMWMVSHFHYDPVWWNTQGQFTEARLSLPDEGGRLPDVRSAFELVGAHLDKARRDADYKFVLAEIDYLKPYFDAFPQDREDLRRLMAEGRVEIVGGNYNEPNTNLISAEAIIRNAVYGIGFQRDVFGGDPRSAWMLDAFGHDPGYPGLMAAAGLTSSAWARGPFHQWGPSGAEGGDRRMQFGTEFEWISPDGHGLLTAYMAHHYGAGWRLHTLPDLQAAELEAYGQFRGLAQVATTRNVLLPVGSDHVIPARWVTDIHRDWNQRYVWPRFTTAVPREFFDAVRAEASSGGHAGAWITPQTRDMNPVYTGKDVSYIDTKQAQRAIETAVAEAERLGTLAWLAGAPYPHAALDKAWRLLAYGAHHDGITGVESDQVYLDLLGGWREAWELSSAARHEAVAYLAGPTGPDLTVSVANGLARPRDGMTRVTVRVPENGTRWLEVRDDSGAPVPSVAEGVRRRPDGSLAEVTVTFPAVGVPALGLRTYRLQATQTPASEWREAAGTVIENAVYLVTADPARGGTVSITDKRTGTDVLTGPGNELVIQDEYAQHPRHGEGPWHLSPKGPGTGSSSLTAQVRAERCEAGSRLLTSFTLDGLEVTQETLLWDGAERVEFRTHVDSYRGRDRLLRVRFPAAVPGGLPVYQTATAVIGRSFGAVDVDSADHWYTLDNPAHQWFGLGSTARVRIGDPRGLTQAIGVAEVVCPLLPNGLRDTLRELLVALAAAGVTATCSQADGSRYGAIDADSNLPDVRIAVGGPEVNPLTAEVLAAAGPGYVKALAARLDAGSGAARLWVPAARDRADTFGPDADVRGADDLPVLIVAGAGPAELAAAVTALAGDLADAVVDVGDLADTGSGADAGSGAGDGDRPAPVPLADRSVALLNRGTPGCVVTPDGTLHMSLMRSCSAWPSGIWIDGDRRNAPDGSSFAWQHWSHTFEYALASGAGDWRTAGFNLIAEDYSHDLIAVTGGAGQQSGAGLLSVEPATVTVSALKPRGNPLAAGRVRALTDTASEDATITVRLRETSGRATTARVRLGSGAGAVSAWLTDLLEESDGAPLPVEDGTVAVDMPAFGTVNVLVSVSSASRGGDPPRPPRSWGELSPQTPLGGDKSPQTVLEPQTPLTPHTPLSPLASQMPLVEPIYARYWLHGKGPAPVGNLPVAVHFSPVRVALAEPDEAVALTLTVGCGAEPASGVVELITPAEVIVATEADLRYQLAPGGYAAWDLAVRVSPGTAAGRYFVAARIRDDLGHLVEDTAMIAVGEHRWPDPDLPPEETIELMQADYRAAAAEVDVAVLTPELRLTPGGQGELLVRVTSGLASELHGEAQLVSPFGTWEMLGPPAQGFSIAPETSTVLRFVASVPVTARHAQWWALVKVMYYGRVRYTEAIPVVIEPVN
jgi:alpha-mannosidase